MFLCGRLPVTESRSKEEEELFLFLPCDWRFLPKLGP